MGFAPAIAPTIAVGLIVEQGGSGAHAAAPVGRAIFEAFLPKLANVQSAPTQSAPALASRPNAQSPADEELPIDELEVLIPDGAVAPTDNEITPQ